MANLSRTVMEQLPRDQTMIAGAKVSEAIPSHYQAAQVTGWHSNHMIHVAVAFPLEQTGPRYTRYTVTAPPIPDPSGKHYVRCLSQLYYGEDPQGSCEWKLLVTPPPALWKWEAQQQQWHYFLATPTLITEQCPDESATEITLTRNGMIKP
ncbi:hypothetical protein GE061_001411 [Apolygus lucorum]|uniref:Uncharacterized protein n=1 Tax=Apolygus lucorum TaxID=248454 RepID=A0A8S9YA30_APOLU|nr:hypothetical protein GE061_001411 [Apolygus lucorum]